MMVWFVLWLLNKNLVERVVFSNSPKQNKWHIKLKGSRSRDKMLTYFI